MTLPLETMSLLIGLTAGVGAYFIVLGAYARQDTGLPSRGELLGSRSLVRRSGRDLLISGLFGSLAGILALAITGVIGLGIAVAFVAGMAGFWVKKRREVRRVRHVEESYPDLIEATIAHVRSGTGLMESLAQAATNSPPSIAQPAFRLWERARVSGDVSACLDELKAEWESPTGDALVETLRVAHEVGGTRVVDVLRELADHTRRDRNLRREVEAKQSWVRVAARVGVAAPWVVLVLLSLRSEAAMAYNSPMGITLILAGLALSIIAYRLMLSLGRTPMLKRSFSS